MLRALASSTTRIQAGDSSRGSCHAVGSRFTGRAARRLPAQPRHALPRFEL